VVATFLEIVAALSPGLPAVVFRVAEVVFACDLMSSALPTKNQPEWKTLNNSKEN
jgi:hypothetical protein